MYNPKIVNFALSMVQAIKKPNLNIIDMAALINSSASQLLTLMSQDPISSAAYNFGKAEFEIAQNILKNIQYEGDYQGALQRTISHLETAKVPIVNYYHSEVSNFNNSCFSILTALPSALTGYARQLHLDIVKVTFYELICHTLTGSKSEKLEILISDIPIDSDYSFYQYTTAISQLFAPMEWADILEVRKSRFISSIGLNVARAVQSYKALEHKHLDEYTMLDWFSTGLRIGRSVTGNAQRHFMDPEHSTNIGNCIEPPLIQFLRDKFDPEELKKFGIDWP